MLAGLQNAAWTIQHFIGKVIYSMDLVYAYVDCSLIAIAPVEFHQQHLTPLFQHLQFYRVKVNSVKCVFASFLLEFLKQAIEYDGIHSLFIKVKAIQDLLPLTSVCQFCHSLGLINFY